MTGLRKTLSRQCAAPVCREGDFYVEKLSVKMKITLWYTGLIEQIILSAILAVLLATDKVLLLVYRTSWKKRSMILPKN